MECLVWVIHILKHPTVNNNMVSTLIINKISIRSKVANTITKKETIQTRGKEALKVGIIMEATITTIKLPKEILIIKGVINNKCNQSSYLKVNS